MAAGRTDRTLNAVLFFLVFVTAVAMVVQDAAAVGWKQCPNYVVTDTGYFVSGSGCYSYGGWNCCGPCLTNRCDLAVKTCFQDKSTGVWGWTQSACTYTDTGDNICKSSGSLGTGDGCTADAACNGKLVGTSCGAGSRRCNSNCACVVESGTTTTTMPIPCNFQTASMAADCDGGASPDCEAGETVYMSGTYSGTCSAADLLQIDAASADELCDIQYMGGDMSGVWDSVITLSGGIVTDAAWAIPAVAADCAGKTVLANAAALWDGLPGVGTRIDGAETVSGEFKFAGGAATTTTTTTTTLPGNSFTLAIKPGWNLISVPYRTIYGAEQDGCGMTNGNFYFYDAATGKWNVRTVGVANLRKATSYWFYSAGYCAVIVKGYDDVAESDVVLAKNEWSDVGAPKGGMTVQSLNDAACPTCAGNRCSWTKVLYYDTLAGQFKVAASLQEGVGYRVQCVV